MKNHVMPSIVQMDAEELRTLMTEVKETVATGYNMSEQPKKSFGIADLWKIRRNAKTTISLLRR